MLRLVQKIPVDPQFWFYVRFFVMLGAPAGLGFLSGEVILPVFMSVVVFMLCIRRNRGRDNDRTLVLLMTAYAVTLWLVLNLASASAL